MTTPDTPLTDYTDIPGGDEAHVTYCRLCEAHCGLVAKVEQGQVTQIVPDAANPHSRGRACVKGTNFHRVTHDPDRVLYPLKRVGGPGEFERVTWDEALDDIARRLGDIIGRYGTDAFGTIFGNPSVFGIATAFAPMTFMKALGATRMFSPHSEDSGATLLAGTLLFGRTSYTFPDLPECDHLLVFGSNPLVSNGSLVVAPRIKDDLDAIAARGRVIVIDPRRTETARRYEHVAVQPDGDAWLIAAMLREIQILGRVDTAFLEQWTTGGQDLLRAIDPVTPEVASAYCGLAPDEIRTLARDYSQANKPAAIARLGISRGQFPTLSNFLLNALNIVSGRFHRSGGVGFGHGAVDSGAMSEAAGMKGYQPGASRVSSLPSVMGSLPSVTLLDEMTQEGEGRLRALVVTAANPLMSMPGGGRLPGGFAGLDLMVCFDLYAGETARHAHYILPGLTFLERPDVPILFLGHMLRPHVQATNAVVPPQGEARCEWEAFRDLAARMGLKDAFGEASPMEMADAILRSGPEGMAQPDGRPGISLDFLKLHPHGVPLTRDRWDFNLADRIGHPDGRIHLWCDEVAAEIVRMQAHAAYSGEHLRLFSSRKLKSLNSWLHNVDRLSRSDTPKLIIHPADAASRGIREGDAAIVSTSWGSVTVFAHVSDEVTPGSVTYPHGWGHEGGWLTANRKGGANINAIAPASAEAVEQLSGMSFLDGFPVTVVRAAAADVVA